MKLNESKDNTNMLQVGESKEKTSSHWKLWRILL